ncbi:MAG: uroporphyrinogen-III synthase [Campylobacter sp.]|nr:uroporphyrinogen-III synthase [Campylobacter sp.]
MAKSGEIYLISHTKPEDKSIKHLQVCGIKFNHFNINLIDFDALVVTSKNSIKSLKFNDIIPLNLEVFSIGEGSTKEAKSFGFRQIYTAKNSHGNEFAYEIAPLLNGKKTFFPKAEVTVSDVDKILEKSGINLITQNAYKTVYYELNQNLKPPKNSILIFASPSNVLGFKQNFSLDNEYKIISIGDATAKFLKDFPNLTISSTQSIEECIKIAKNLV